jgi:L-alanine-DL-glutamate epimerase-like enolase superfamily enzyme
MTIRSVTATRFALPFARQIALSTGIRETAEHVLVAVTTQGGVTGYAECIPRPAIYGETIQTAPTIIEELLAAAVIGLDESDLSMVHARLAKLAGNPSARSAVELAAFDAHCKTIGKPAHIVLGGFATDVACVPVLGYGTPEQVVLQAQRMRSEFGVETVKFKIGPDVTKDIAVAVALRAQLGSAVGLYADANGRYSVPEALIFLDATRGCGLRWLEEPVSADDIEGRRAVAAHATMPILGDESCADPRTVAVEVQDGRSTAISIKIARTGIVSSAAIRDHCAAAGTPTLLGTQGDSAIGAFTAAAFACSSRHLALQPAEVMFFLDLADQLTTDVPSIVDGKLILSDRPGFGFDIDAEKVAQYRV